jgi:hypothetical protein
MFSYLLPEKEPRGGTRAGHLKALNSSFSLPEREGKGRAITKPLLYIIGSLLSSDSFLLTPDSFL